MELILGTAKDMTVIHQMILYRIGSMDPVIRTTSTDLTVPKDVRLPMIIVIALLSLRGSGGGGGKACPSGCIVW